MQPRRHLRPDQRERDVLSFVARNPDASRQTTSRFRLPKRSRRSPRSPRDYAIGSQTDRNEVRAPLAAAAEGAALSFDDIVRQFVRGRASLWKMAGQQFARRCDRFHQRLGKIFAQEMFSHPGDQITPKFLATFLVNAFVADDREFLDARSDKNQDSIPFLR